METFLLITVLVIELALIVLYVLTARQNKSNSLANDVGVLNRKLERVSGDLDKRINEVVTISNANTNAIMGRFQEDADEIDRIVSKMEKCAEGIAQVDKDVKEIRRYYVNYCSKTEAE